MILRLVLTLNILLSGCGVTANIKSFSTRFGDPIDTKRASLRVVSNGMVRGVPQSDCVDWYIPGSGVIVSRGSGFSDRNGEKIGMPEGQLSRKIINSKKDLVSTEIYIPAGSPITLTFVWNYRTAYFQYYCDIFKKFVPEEGRNYELIMYQNGYSCYAKLEEITSSGDGEEVLLEDAKYCRPIMHGII